jgi:hypothetical protein
MMSSGRGWFWGVRSLYFLYFRRLNPPFGLQLSREFAVSDVCPDAIVDRVWALPPVSFVALTAHRWTEFY